MSKKTMWVGKGFRFYGSAVVGLGLLLASNSNAQQVVFDSLFLGKSDIYVVDTNGGGAVNLTNDSSRFDSNPQWSPDGTKIAYVSAKSAIGDIAVIDTDGGNQMLLTSSAAKDCFPMWSPDGTKILFQREEAGNRDLYVMNADGSAQTQLTNAAGDDGQASWSPDGSKILFQSFRDGNGELYVMNADGSAQTNLTNHPKFETQGGFSPDGLRILFTTTRDSFLGEIYVMNADGSNPVNLTNHPKSDTGARWAPDGMKILFRSERDGNNEIFVMNADGSNQTNLTSDGASDIDGRWTADGSRIIFNAQRHGNNQVYVMNADGSNQTNLSNSERFDSNATPSPKPSSGTPPVISSGGIVLANLAPSVASVSPLSIFSVFGQNFSTETLLFPNLDGNGDLDTILGGTCLMMNGEALPIFAVTPGQINAQASAAKALGPASFTVVANCGTAAAISSAPLTIERGRQASPTPRELTSNVEMATVEETTPGFFLFPPLADDGIIAARFNATATQAAVPVAPTSMFPNDSFGPSRPAIPGDIILLYGTGWGETTAGLGAGELASGAATLLPAAIPMVTFGGIPLAPADVFYVGVTPGTAGLYQLAIRVPATAIPGNNQVILTVYGKSTPAGPVIPVAAP